MAKDYTNESDDDTLEGLPDLRVEPSENDASEAVSIEGLPNLKVEPSESLNKTSEKEHNHSLEKENLENFKFQNLKIALKGEGNKTLIITIDEQGRMQIRHEKE